MLVLRFYNVISLVAMECGITWPTHLFTCNGLHKLSPQLTAFFTSARILASSSAVNFMSAYEFGHMAPSSSFALSVKPRVWYLALNFPAFWKKQMMLPSLVYAGIPYQVFGASAGAAALIREWSFLATVRSGSCIFAIAASSSVSPSALAASAFSSRARSRIAAFSSSVNPLDVLPIAVALLAAFCVTFFAGFLSAIAKHLGAPKNRK